MYKIIKSDETVTLNGVSVRPFLAPRNEVLLSLQFEFETYEEAAEYIFALQKTKSLDNIEYCIEKN